jgi:RNA polymerase subunit RPABC4/transcription elongation factor Spt4
MAQLCKYCNEKLPRGADVCPACGGRVNTSAFRTCEACKVRTDTTGMFCPSCGAPLPARVTVTRAKPFRFVGVGWVAEILIALLLMVIVMLVGGLLNRIGLL